MSEQSDTPRTDAVKDQMVRVPIKFINKIARERDEARAALLAIKLDAASLADAQVIALEALAATEAKP
jgi:hypothetical protein